MSRPADILPTGILIAILGAGRASRFGADKLNQPCAGKPLGQWSLEAARTVGSPVMWIAGDAAPSFVDCEVALNLHSAQGIGTSVALAARCAAARDASALVILLADMPLVSAALIARLIATGAPAACRYPQGHAGVPALVPASAFAQLQRLTGDHGAGAVLRDLPCLTLLDCVPAELFDVDTPQALAKAERLLLR